MQSNNKSQCKSYPRTLTLTPWLAINILMFDFPSNKRRSKKRFLFSGPDTKRGRGGIKAGPLRKKTYAFVAGLLKEITLFFAASLSNIETLASKIYKAQLNKYKQTPTYSF